VKYNIKDIAENLTNKKIIKIKPIGHHELNRHYVYVLEFENSPPKIFKIFGKKNRMCREIAALNLLKNSNVKCPKEFEYGTLPDGKEWMIYEYINGDLLDNVICMMSKKQLYKIFISIGEELGKIHSIKIFDFFGSWNEKGESLDNIKDYYTYFTKSLQYQYNELLIQHIEDKPLLIKAAEKLMENADLIKNINESRLCHNDFDGRNILVICQNGKYFINGVVDFEQSFPGNAEIDIARLYFRYFLKCKDFEKYFLIGYERYMKIDKGFFERLNYYLLRIGFGICCWTYHKAPKYYKQGLELVKNYINKVK